MRAAKAPPAERREVVDVAHAAEAAPHRRGRMPSLRSIRPSFLPEQAAAAGGVDQPAAADAGDSRRALAAGFDLDRVVEVADLDVAHARRPQQLGAGLDRAIEHVLVEHVAAELERRHGRAHEAAGLARLGVGVRRESLANQ